MSLVIVMWGWVAWLVGTEAVRRSTSTGGVLAAILEAVLWPWVVALALVRVACDAVIARVDGRRA